MRITPASWPRRLVPRRAPGVLAGLAITVFGLAAAILVRFLVLGFDRGLGPSMTYLPALSVITLFAGPHWGWAGLAAAVGLNLLSPSTFLEGDSPALLAMFAASAAITVVISSGYRQAVLRLDAAAAGQAAAQKVAETTESRFRTLADSAPVLMWVTRTDGRREFANRAYVEFLQVDYRSAIDFDWRQVLHPDDVDRVLKEQVAGEASRELFTLEARYRRHDGEYRWVRSISQPRWSADGEFAGFIGVGYDVTEARQAEENLKRINDLLAERVEAALVERDEAEAALHRAQKLEAVGQLTGGVAHDFNNLLTVIIGALDLMQRHPEDEARRERMIEAALSAARRGERLTQQLLAFSRRQALKPEPVEVDALLRDSEQLLRRAVGEAVTLAVSPGAPDAVANLDVSQLEAAVMNLVVNARDATPMGGMIRVESRTATLAAREVEALPAGEYVRISVHDTGAGMEPDVAARAFEPFFTTKEPGRGTGLGLSQVYGFAHQSGGTASVHSAPGKGTTVCIYLPRIQVSVTAPQDRAPDNTPHGPALTVLLAEDDEEVGALVEAMLSDLGHRVRRVPDGANALNVLNAREPIDLLLTDVIMPGEMSGVELARAAVTLRPGLPVILSSGYTGEVLSAAEEAPWPLLRKPYGSEQLALVVAEALRAAPIGKGQAG